MSDYSSFSKFLAGIPLGNASQVYRLIKICLQKSHIIESSSVMSHCAEFEFHNVSLYILYLTDNGIISVNSNLHLV